MNWNDPHEVAGWAQACASSENDARKREAADLAERITDMEAVLNQMGCTPPLPWPRMRSGCSTYEQAFPMAYYLRRIREGRTQ